MTKSFRARALWLAGLLALAPVSFAQTMEIHAGGGKIRNSPGSQAPVVPIAVAIAPDGLVYVADIASSRLLRFDPATGLATVLPGTDPEVPGGPLPRDFELLTNNLLFNSAGELFGSTDYQLFRFDLLTGERTALYVGEWAGGADFQMAFDANGSLYYYKKDDAIYSATNVFKRGQWGHTEHLIQGYDGAHGGDGGPLQEAGIGHATGLALDSAGNLYLSDGENHRVRKITAINGDITRESIITTVAGNGQWWGSGFDEGAPATSVAVGRPGALAVDSAGNLYIHERNRQRIRRVSASDGTITTYAGNGDLGYSGDGGLALFASFDLINGNIAFDAADNLYLAEQGSMRLRRIDAATGIIDTVVGNGTQTFCADVAPRRSACLGGPEDVTTDAAGNLYISDSRNLRIRRVDALTGELRTIAGRNFDYLQSGDGGPAIDASFASDPGGIALDASGNLLIAGSWAHNIRRIDAASGLISTIAGSNNSGFSGDGGPATSARFNGVKDVVADANGNLYVADSGNRRIRRISAAGIVTTLAGTGASGFGGDGGPATAAVLQDPDDLKLDAAGNLWFRDNTRLRRIDAGTGVITTVAGNGSYSNSGNGGPAIAAGLGTFAYDVDGAGNIVIASSWELRRIDAVTGIIAPYPQLYPSTPEGEGLQYPSSVHFGSDGHLYIADAGQNLVFRIEGIPAETPDTTPPTITANINGLAGFDDWYRSDVSLNWDVSDGESTASTSDGCVASAVTEDTDGITFTCSATSAGGTATRSVTIRRDTVAPTVDLEGFNPWVDEFGWRQHPASAWFFAWDGLSGVHTSSPNPTMINAQGAGVSVDITVTDRAGNSTTISTPPINQDFSPPAIASDRAGATGNDGWYTRDVILNWQVIEDESPVRSQQGCDDPLLNYDTPSVTFTCSATSGGGSITASITLKRDATPPSLVFGPPSPTPNANGWHTGDVTFPFTTADGTSGVASVSSPGGVAVITGEGAGLTTSVTVIDAAGNAATFTTPPVNIDRSTVAVAPVITGVLGNEGWYRSDIGVSWNVTGNVVSSTGCAPSTVTTDTAGVTFTCSVTGSSNSASQSVTVKRDATPPVLTWRAATPSANAAGWNRTNVSFPYNTPTDARSGVASVSAASPIVVSAEGTGVTASVTVTDRAGNSAVFTTAPRNIDKTAPAVNILMPAHNSVIGLYATAHANYSCADAISGITSCTGTLANGAQLNTQVMNGGYTLRVTGTDIAGNSFQRSNTYTTAGSFLFEGYLAPMQNDPTFNLVTAGSRVPMRFKLPDRIGGYVSHPGVMQSFTVNNERCLSNVVPLNDVAVGGAGLSFDAATSTYTYNWDTSASWAGTCRNIQLRLIDGSRHTLMFKFQ